MSVRDHTYRWSSRASCGETHGPCSRGSHNAYRNARPSYFFFALPPLLFALSALPVKLMLTVVVFRPPLDLFDVLTLTAHPPGTFKVAI